jgi:hypothetical protein
VIEFYAILKARNFRSEALLKHLGFSRVEEPAAVGIEEESGEIVMHKLAL